MATAWKTASEITGCHLWEWCHRHGMAAASPGRSCTYSGHTIVRNSLTDLVRKHLTIGFGLIPMRDGFGGGA